MGDKRTTVTMLQKDFCGMKVLDGGTVTLEDQDRTLAGHLNVAGDAQREGKFDLADEVLRQVLADYALTELPIEALCPLTIRALNVLLNADVTTLADLIRCKLSDLRHWYNFGAISRLLLGDRMRALGLNLAAQHDYAWIRPLTKRRRAKQRLDRLMLLPTFLLVSDALDLAAEPQPAETDPRISPGTSRANPPERTS